MLSLVTLSFVFSCDRPEREVIGDILCDVPVFFRVSSIGLVFSSWTTKPMNEKRPRTAMGKPAMIVNCCRICTPPMISSKGGEQSDDQTPHESVSDGGIQCSLFGREDRQTDRCGVDRRHEEREHEKHEQRNQYFTARQLFENRIHGDCHSVF